MTNSTAIVFTVTCTIKDIYGYWGEHDPLPTEITKRLSNACVDMPVDVDVTMERQPTDQPSEGDPVRDSYVMDGKRLYRNGKLIRELSEGTNSTERPQRERCCCSHYHSIKECGRCVCVKFHPSGTCSDYHPFRIRRKT